MGDFFKNIKDNLDNRDEPPFNQDAWEKMEKKLNKKTWNKILPLGWFWVFPFALGALFLSNIIIFKKLNEANEKISKIEQRTDTIYKTNYIYQYDTIYRQSVEKQYVVLKQPSNNFNPFQGSYFVAPANFSQRSSWPDLDQYAFAFSDLKYLFGDENEVASDENNPALNSPPAFYTSPFIESDFALLNNESGYPYLTYLNLPSFPKRKKRPFQKLAAEVQPIDFQLGVMAGLAFPIHKKVEETGGYSFGIHGAVTFFDRIRMWAEASHFKVKFKSNEMGESLGIPVISNPAVEYDFVEATVNQPFYQYVFGFQYIYNAKKKWSPYLGIGYTFGSLQSYEVIYDFENDVDGIELSIEETHIRSDLIINMALFNAGVEAKLSKHIGLQLEGYYRWHGNNEGLLVTDMLGVRSKLIYNF